MTAGDPNETSDTTIGNGSARISARPAPGIQRVDLRDEEAVYKLACVLRNASVRRLMQVILAEHRAVAALAADSAPLASQAREYLRLLAEGAAAAEIKSRLEAMAETAGIHL